MSSPEHGQYRAGWGFYSTGTGNWHSDASKIGPGSGGAPDREPDANARAEFERQQANARGDFKTSTDMEQLIVMRESPHQEKREMFEKLVAGPRRMELHSYEESKRAASNKGGQ